MIDHPGALEQFFEYLHSQDKKAKPSRIGVFVKVDTGYQRAGVVAASKDFDSLLDSITQSQVDYPNAINFKGFYSHLGNSYGGSSESDALEGLIHEIERAETAAKIARDRFGGTYTVTVGATPTATAAQNIIARESEAVQKLKSAVAGVMKNSYLELHAGVYPLLDLQQVATQARPAVGESQNAFEPLSMSNIGLRSLVEVTSLYHNREKPSAMIAAGTLALGREPCKSYPGWGIVTPWPKNKDSQAYDPHENKRGWIVGKISQEHGILTWEGAKNDMRELKVGEKLLIWPNHACVAGAGFGWYLVIDSDADTDRIVDVWIRWRGW